MIKLTTLLLCGLLVGCVTACASTIALWTFNSPLPDNDATTGTTTPEIGAGTASLAGGVTASFTASNGSSDPSTDNSNSRITSWPAQGTQNKQNGIRLNVGTVGYRNIALSWDLRNSNTASKYTRLQYTTNGTDFLDFLVIAMPNATWINSQSASFVGVPGVDGNSKFGVRFVTEFELTALGTGTNGYVPASPTSTYGAGGTLRFDMVRLSGDCTVSNLSMLTYNILGNGALGWTLASGNVQAVGRQLGHLQPDVIGFQEVPEDFRLQMTNFIGSYLPGYYVAIGSATGGSERSAVASRYPIARSKSWLIDNDLTPYGYAGTFTRDLFEAQIVVPDFPQPFHFFTTHLKAHTDQDSAERRGAEARAISNFLAYAYLTTNSLHPYVLVGDMNEDIYRPRTYEQGVIQALTSSPTGLRLTTPRNPVTADDRTWSIQNANLTIRFDYVLPCALLYYSATDGRVFRSDKVSPPSPPLLASDSATAADHLPVMLTFRNPYNAPLVISSLALTNRVATLRWAAVPGERYRVETSERPDFSPVASTSIVATQTGVALSVPATNSRQFFRLLRIR
ncbi:MAG TPA: endonuclease/exonuclease/phosphatase family protein [Candidatus Paceibacterota bacterium]|nr:endonuclease/exonuclease/phosphatase family protein [Verrucomicrobiota bacterium]HSA12375.1 endonuclease/exonuclease/phosphatase family protein [Candidatus Paceibacterota bacterium]